MMLHESHAHQFAPLRTVLLTGALLSLALLSALPLGTTLAEELPGLPGVLDSEKEETESELTDFEAPTERHILIPANTGEVSFSFRMGKAISLTLTLVWEKGRKTDLLFRIADAKYKKKLPGGTLRSVEQRLPDACLEIPSLKSRYFVRPNPVFHSEKNLEGLRAEWATMPGPADHRFLLSLQMDDAGVALSLDGNLVGRVDRASRLKEVVFPLPEDTAVKLVPRSRWEPWSRLDLRSLNRPGVMKDAVLEVDEDILKRAGVPLSFPVAGANADVGCVRDVSPPTNIDDSIYRYLERSALDGLPGALLKSVPVAAYTRAWVLCAAEDDPAKEPFFNVRLTRYRKGGIGNAMVTTAVDVPLDKDAGSATCRYVGEAIYRGKDGQIGVPLWLAEVSLNSSEIQDVLYSNWNGGRLDFELKGRKRNSKSGVHVFAVTLEKSPVEMEVKQVIPGSVFHNEELPEMKVALRARSVSAGFLRWSVEDVWRNEVATGERGYRFTKEAESQELSVPLKMKDYGWYQVEFSLHAESGRLLLSHTAAFAQLPPDTRKAGYESPFGCWWQQYLHSHMTDPKIIGPLLFKAGIRRTTHTAQSEAVMKPWKVTIDMVPWFGGYRTPGAPKLTTEEWQAEYQKRLRDYLEKFPHAGLAMVFHESYRSAMAPEVWGGEPDPVTATEHIKKAKLACAMLRENYPNLKIIVGNSGWSGALMSQLLRGGLPADQIDGLGMERLIGYFAKDTMPPERHEASWTLQKVALKYGCKAPPTDCYESGGRGSYGMSQRMIAEYVVRDSLVGMAWRYPYIGVGVISENVNGYYHTRWGGDALLRRTPLLYPQPQYVAIATMTRVLDRVKLIRRVPTGSHTAYALEFERGDERVYALWTPRGTCDMTLKFNGNPGVKVEGHYGRTRQTDVVNGELRIKATEEVTYVTAAGAATSVIAGARSFPLDQPPDHTVVVAPLNRPSAWTWTNSKAVECGPFPYGWLPWRAAGKGKLSVASDPEKGECVRLELLSRSASTTEETPQGELPELVSECLSLQARSPVPVPGKPSTIGVWVKGNSCWGRVMFEIMDAEGERFRGGQYAYEPRGTTYLNFDGWCFVALPLSENSPVRDRFYYSPSRLWTSNGGNGEIDYPIRVTGLTVTLKRKALDLAEMLPVAPSILLKELSVYGQPDKFVVRQSWRSEGRIAAEGDDSPTTNGAEMGTVLFTDADLYYAKLGARPPGFSEGCVLREEDGKRFVSCEPGVKSLFKNLRHYGSQHWLDYEWSFRFRFPVKGKVGFSGLLRTGISASPFLKSPPMGPEDKCSGVGIEFSAKGFEPAVVGGFFQMARGHKWAEKGLPPLESGRWYRTVIRAAGRALDVSLEHEGKLVEVYRGPIPAGGGGVGLSSTNPIDLADLKIREVVPTTEDWSYAGRIREDDDSPIPTTKSKRIDGPFMITDAIALTSPDRPCILSAYVRAEKDGVPVTMIFGSKTKIVRAPREWKRYSFLAMAPQDAEEDARCTFGLKGSDEGAIWFAAPQVEYAPFDPTAKRAEHWLRTLDADYELDEKITHRGSQSLRIMNTGSSPAVQEGEFAAEEARPLLLGAWRRTKGSLKEAKLKLELFRDSKHWTPKTPTEEEPRETFELQLKANPGKWEYATARITPKFRVKRYRLSVVVESTGGTLWLDDLTLRPLGTSRGAPNATTAADDPLQVETDPEPGEDLSLLEELGDAADTKGNVLKNPGFEKLMTRGVVTSKSDRPSSYGPTNTPKTWMKSRRKKTLSD